MRVLIIANAPGTLEISNIGYDVIIALDGAVNKLSDSAIIPDYIVGDMDAAPKKLVESLAAQGSLVVQIDDQNSTDLDKGINYADELGATSIDIVNALGGRMDHTLYNVRILKKYYSNKRRIIIHEQDELLEYYADCELKVEGNVDSPLAIMSSPDVTVDSKGLNYNMDGLRLVYGARESSCNSLAAKHAEIKLRGGAIIIYDKTTSLVKKQTS
jgi:thiamine pyrophosphokinase